MLLITNLFTLQKDLNLVVMLFEATINIDFEIWDPEQEKKK